MVKSVLVIHVRVVGHALMELQAIVAIACCNTLAATVNKEIWCAPNPRQNGGMCIEATDTFLMCNCSEQYTGNTCEQRKRCFPNSCRICSEGPHSSRCTCPPEYTGTHCEHKITVTLTLAESRCQPRYTSTRCERHNYCYPNHCRNGGRCINGLYSYTCRCPSTFIGTRCDYRIGRFQIYARYGRGLSDQDGW